ncbi:MAG: IPT/TIG domain-containing protein, partial [Acidobacteria bacterium]|nr:IPT/TIG domain-containing protein [Acidobacteriota bacterium]
GAGAPTLCQGVIIDDVPVTGSNFLPNLTTENVDFGPAVQTRGVTVVNPNLLLVDISVTDAVSSIGVHAITITNPLPDGSQATLPGAVNVVATPTVTGISNSTIAQGTSQVITITGSNFVEVGTSVTITPAESGVYVTNVDVVSESQITATLHSDEGSQLGTFNLVVTAPGGEACSTFTFNNAITNVAAPRIIRIDPSTIGAGMQNVNVTITGSGFQPGAQVRLYHGGSGDPRSEDGYVTFCDGGSMIYVRPGGGFIDPTRIVVCLNVYESAPPMFIPVEVVNPDNGTAFAYDKLSVSVPNQPTPPSDLSAELFPNGKVTLTFQDNATNETGFVVEQSLNGGAWTVAKNIKANRGIGTITCTLTGLRAGNDYDFRVKAVNRSDGNIASPAAMLNYSVDVDSKISGKPVINVLEYIVDKDYYDGVLIEWSPPSGGEVRSYSIQRATNGGPWVSVGAVDGSQTEFFDTDVVTGAKYSYRIEARNNFNTKVSRFQSIRP